MKAATHIWQCDKGDVEVSPSEWLPQWNVPPAERRISRPHCSVHWIEGVEKQLLPGDKVFRRESRSQFQGSLIYLIERNGKVVGFCEQVLWKAIE